MASCPCIKHEEFSRGREFSVYKFAAKKHKKIVERKLKELGYVTQYASALCTACAKYCEDHLLNQTCSEQTPKKIKIDYNDINKVIKYIESGVLKEEILVRIASALGGSQKENIYNDILDINSSYKNESVLKSFNVNNWLSDRNAIVTEFLKSCSGVTNDATNSKKLLCVANSVDSLYKARCLNLVTPLAFAINLVGYYLSGSKIICSLNNSTSPAGSYPTLRSWINLQREAPLNAPQNGDIITFFDNNQILSRNWRVNYDHKCKVSVITTVIHIVPGFPTQLQMAPNFSPLKWLYIDRDSHFIVTRVEELLTHAKERFKCIRNEYITERLAKVYKEQNILTGNSLNNCEANNHCSQDPYDWVPSKHNATNPKIIMGETDFLNPCSYKAVEEVLQHIQIKTCSDINERKWTIVGMVSLMYWVPA